MNTETQSKRTWLFVPADLRGKLIHLPDGMGLGDFAWDGDPMRKPEPKAQTVTGNQAR